MDSTSRSVLVWSVDPNEVLLKPSGSSLRILESRNVLPVAISSPDGEITRRKLRDYLKKMKIMGVSSARLLTSDTFNRTDFVKKLILFSLENNASAIALTSHGRKGIDRLVMGSFAENLLNVSPLPVLFLTDANFKPSRRALFATDLSSESEKAFHNFAKFCDGYINELIIFHVAHSIVEDIAIYGAAGVPAMFPETFLEKSNETEAIVNDWVEKYSHTGKFKIRVLLQDSNKSVSKSILDTCKAEEVELIGVSSSMRPWERTLFGSVARDVFRNGKIPVWIWGENASEELIKIRGKRHEKSDYYPGAQSQGLR